MLIESIGVLLVTSVTNKVDLDHMKDSLKFPSRNQDSIEYSFSGFENRNCYWVRKENTYN